MSIAAMAVPLEAPMGDARPALAVDVGGTNLPVGVADPGGRLIASAHRPTPRDLDAEQLWRTLDAQITQVLRTAGVRGAAELAGVGCGCGGPMGWAAGRGGRVGLR